MTVTCSRVCGISRALHTFQTSLSEPYSTNDLNAIHCLDKSNKVASPRREMSYFLFVAWLQGLGSQWLSIYCQQSRFVKELRTWRLFSRPTPQLELLSFRLSLYCSVLWYHSILKDSNVLKWRNSS